MEWLCKCFDFSVVTKATFIKLLFVEPARKPTDKQPLTATERCRLPVESSRVGPVMERNLLSQNARRLGRPRSNFWLIGEFRQLYKGS